MRIKQETIKNEIKSKRSEKNQKKLRNMGLKQNKPRK